LQLANLPAAGTAVLAEMVKGLIPAPTTESAMAEDNSQPTAWGPGPGMGRQNNTIAVAKISYPGDSTGKDGFVRVVTILAPKVLFKNPVNKICPLPCISEM